MPRPRFTGIVQFLSPALCTQQAAFTGCRFVLRFGTRTGVPQLVSRRDIVLRDSAGHLYSELGAKSGGSPIRVVPPGVTGAASPRVVVSFSLPPSAVPSQLTVAGATFAAPGPSGGD